MWWQSIHMLIKMKPFFSFFFPSLRWYRTDALTYMFFNNWLIYILSQLLTHIYFNYWLMIHFSFKYWVLYISSQDKIYKSQLLRNIFLKASLRYHRTSFSFEDMNSMIWHMRFIEVWTYPERILDQSDWLWISLSFIYMIVSRLFCIR